MPRTTTRRRSTWLVGLTSCVTALTSTGVVTPLGVAHAAVDPCLEPIATEINVSQGLPTYTNLIRGKSTEVKAFMSEKSSSGGCSSIKSASIYVTGGAVTVNTTTPTDTPLALPSGSSLPALPVNGTTIAPDSPADPVFVVPGSKISAPVSGPLSFKIRVDYVTKSDSTGATLQTGSVTFTTYPGGTTTIAKPVAPATRPLRLLVVPMGDATSTAPALSSARLATLQNALTAAARIEPVADGVGDLTDLTAGLRYTVSAGLVNLGVHDETQADGTTVSRNYLPGGQFCGASVNFTYIKQKLSEFRGAWNTEHPTAPADRVLGVVPGELSDGPSTNVNSTCAEGYAAINSPEAWVRLAEPPSGSPSGGVAALELDHTYGGVVGVAGYHSTTANADATAVGRAFNVATQRQLPAPKSDMRFDVAGWDNYTTLFEKRDFDFTACMLASTASPATECGSSTSGGTSAPAGGGFVLDGVTDLTPAGTDLHTHYDIDPPADGLDASSNVKLVLLDATNNPVGTYGLRTTNKDSNHSHTGDVTAGTDDVYGIDVAIPGQKAAAFEVRKTSTNAAPVVLYRRELVAAPTIGDLMTRSGASAERQYTADGVSSQPSAGGALVAISRGGNVVLSAPDAAAALASVPGQAGALDATGTQLLVASNGDLTLYPVSRAGSTVTVGAGKTVYSGGGVLSPGAASNPALVGTTAVFTVAGDLYAVDTTSSLLPVSATLCGVTDATQSLGLPVNPCSRWTSTPGVTETAGSFDATRGLLAYTATTGTSRAVWTLSPTAPTTTQALRIPNAGDPAWAGDLLVVSGPTGLVAYDAATYATPTRLTRTVGDVQPAASGGRVFWTRPNGSATDVWTLSLDRSTLVFTATSPTPGNLRADVYLDCGDGPNPVLTALRPDSTTATSATFSEEASLVASCATPTWHIDVTDGYTQTTRRFSAAPGSTLPSAAVYSPQDGSTQLASEALVLAGGATGDYTWTVFGPAGSGYENGVVVSHAATYVLNGGTTGFTPGAWRVRLDTTGPDGTASYTSRVTLNGDRDGDGIPDTDDTQAKHPCYPADAVSSSINASTDYDNDLLISLIDPDPCTSALNATVNFDANSINLGSAGNYLTVYVTSSAFDLRQLTAANTKVVQLGSYPVTIVATSIQACSATTATIKFSRQAFQSAYQSLGLTGYVPVLISGTNGTATFSGFDPSAPTYNP